MRGAGIHEGSLKILQHLARSYRPWSRLGPERTKWAFWLLNNGFVEVKDDERGSRFYEYRITKKGIEALDE